jgi:hypothetical protein
VGSSERLFVAGHGICAGWILRLCPRSDLVFGIAAG